MSLPIYYPLDYLFITTAVVLKVKLTLLDQKLYFVPKIQMPNIAKMFVCLYNNVTVYFS